MSLHIIVIWCINFFRDNSASLPSFYPGIIDEEQKQQWCFCSKVRLDILIVVTYISCWISQVSVDPNTLYKYLCCFKQLEWILLFITKNADIGTYKEISFFLILFLILSLCLPLPLSFFPSFSLSTPLVDSVWDTNTTLSLTMPLSRSLSFCFSYQRACFSYHKALSPVTQVPSTPALPLGFNITIFVYITGLFLFAILVS